MQRAISRHTKDIAKFQLVVREWPTTAILITSPDYFVGTTVWSMDVMFPSSNPDDHELPLSISIKNKTDHTCLAFQSVKVIGVISSTMPESSMELAHFSSIAPQSCPPGFETSWTQPIHTHSSGDRDTATSRRFEALTFELIIVVYGQRETIFPQSPFPNEKPVATLGEELSILVFGPDASPCYSDITLVSGTTRLACHRVILSARSATFKKKFQSRYFGVRALLTQGEYVIDGIEPEVLKYLVGYIYSDTCSTEVLASHAQPLLAAAKRFRVEGLVVLCEDYLIDNLEALEATDRFLFALAVGSPRLEFASLAVMALNMHETMHSKSYSKLDADSCRRLLALTNQTDDAIIDILRDELSAVLRPSLEDADSTVVEKVGEGPGSSFSSPERQPKESQDLRVESDIKPESAANVGSEIAPPIKAGKEDHGSLNIEEGNETNPGASSNAHII